MDYKTGSYILLSKINWQCDMCKKTIYKKTKCFVRIKEYGETKTNKKGIKYKYKSYTRWHLKCARNLANLNEYEQKIIRRELQSDRKFKYTYNETSLRQGILGILKKLERQEKLTYVGILSGTLVTKKSSKIYSIGKTGFSDLVIFPKNQKPLFVELKTIKSGKKLNNNQIKFKQLVNNLKFEYHIISNSHELRTLLLNHNILV